MLACDALLVGQSLQVHKSDNFLLDNARFYTYGNLDLKDHLSKISDYLSSMDKITQEEPVKYVPNEVRWSEPRKLRIECAPDPALPGSTLAISYLICDINDSYESFVFKIIGELLTDGPNAPFYKTLLESGLGTGFAPITGYEGDTKDTIFSVGIQGMDIGKEEEVIKKIKDTFVDVVNEGFEEERVEAIVHRLELSMKNKSNNFGLNLIMGLTPLWNQTEDPFPSLNINDKIKKLQDDLKNNPRFLQDKVKEHFCDNNHHLILTMSPEESYTEKTQKALDDVRDESIKDLTDKDKAKILRDTINLKEAQNKTDDVSCLPTLSIQDIADKSPSFDISKVSNIMSLSSQPTNGVAYFRSLISTSGLSDELAEVLPLFLGIVSKIGAGSFDYRKLDTEIDLCSGGLSFSYHIHEDSGDLSKFTEGILLSSHCLERNSDRMFHLWSLLFHDLKYDSDRIKTLIQMFATESMNGLVYSGHSYAMGNSGMNLTPGSFIRETHGGLEYLKYLNKSVDCNIDELIEKFRQIAKFLLNKSNMKIHLNTTESHSPDFIQSATRFLDSINGEVSSVFPSKKVSDFDVKNGTKRYISTPFPVNYVGKAVRTCPYDNDDFASLRIAARLASWKFLHTEIREKGGAYGGGASAQDNGLFLYYSYRDPNSDATLNTFDKTSEWLLSNKFLDADIVEAKLGVFQKVDVPVLPGNVGLREFLTGITSDQFNAHRQKLKSVSRDDILKVTSKYLSPESTSETGVTIIGPEAGANEKKNCPDWDVQTLA